jgi:hypothetical protein
MLRVGEVTPAVIDATYVVLRERGSMKGGPLKPGTLSRIHVVLRSAFSQAQPANRRVGFWWRDRDVARHVRASKRRRLSAERRIVAPNRWCGRARRASFRAL